MCGRAAVWMHRFAFIVVWQWVCLTSQGGLCGDWIVGWAVEHQFFALSIRVTEDVPFFPPFLGPFSVLRGCMRVHRMHGESTCQADVTTCVAYHHGKRSAHHADVLGHQQEGRVSMALWNDSVTGPLATLANLLRHKT